MTNNQDSKKQLRTFGLIWSLIFVVIAFYPLLNDGNVRSLPLYISLFFFVFSLYYPQIYQITHFYQGWIKLGNFVGNINSNIRLPGFGNTFYIDRIC